MSKHPGRSRSALDDVLDLVNRQFDDPEFFVDSTSRTDPALARQRNLRLTARPGGAFKSQRDLDTRIRDTAALRRRRGQSFSTLIGVKRLAPRRLRLRGEQLRATILGARVGFPEKGGDNRTLLGGQGRLGF